MDWTLSCPDGVRKFSSYWDAVDSLRSELQRRDWRDPEMIMHWDQFLAELSFPSSPSDFSVTTPTNDTYYIESSEEDEDDLPAVENTVSESNDDFCPWRVDIFSGGIDDCLVYFKDEDEAFKFLESQIRERAEFCISIGNKSKQWRKLTEQLEWLLMPLDNPWKIVSPDYIYVISELEEVIPQKDQPEWKKDLWKRYKYRWYDGKHYTNYASNGQTIIYDPVTKR